MKFYPFEYVDPSEWNKLNIKSWLDWITKKFKLNPAPIVARFPSTGKELVELSRAEFWVCAGSNEGGNKLADYIACLVLDATGRNISHLIHREDPGISFFLILFLNAHIISNSRTETMFCCEHSIEHSSMIIINIYFRISNSIAD